MLIEEPTRVSKLVGSEPTERLSVAREVIDDHQILGCRLSCLVRRAFDVSKAQDDVYDKIVWVTVGIYSHHIYTI